MPLIARAVGREEDPTHLFAYLQFLVERGAASSAAVLFLRRRPLLASHLLRPSDPAGAGTETGAPRQPGVAGVLGLALCSLPWMQDGDAGCATEHDACPETSLAVARFVSAVSHSAQTKQDRVHGSACDGGNQVTPPLVWLTCFQRLRDRLLVLGGGEGGAQSLADRAPPRLLSVSVATWIAQHAAPETAARAVRACTLLSPLQLLMLCGETSLADPPFQAALARLTSELPYGQIQDLLNKDSAVDERSSRAGSQTSLPAAGETYPKEKGQMCDAHTHSSDVAPYAGL